MTRFGQYSRRRRGGGIRMIKLRVNPAVLAKLLFFCLVGGSLFLIAAFAWYSRELPDPKAIQRKEGFSTQILDRKAETVLFDVYEDENRQFISLEEIPLPLKQATIAIEDKDFYKHQGFDPLAFLRILKNVIFRQRVIGGSTLTQQLVKNVLLTSERKLSRKVKELVLAVQIERKFTKDEILQMYLNEAPYGGTAWGIAAAAQQYFAKKPAELNLTESIILAGMPQAPSRYSPYGRDPLAYVARATDVVRRMREDGYLTSAQEKQVLSELAGVAFRPTGSTIKAPHFVMYVRDQLEEIYGEELVNSGGLKVTTTLDWQLQDKAQQVVAEEIEKVAKSHHITNGASLVMDPETGEVLSMVGSKDFFDKEGDGQVNVTLSQRQPGSLIKPVTYVTAFEEGFWPGKVIADVVTEFPTGKPEPDKYYKPENYDGKEHGFVHLRDALGSSLNVPAVKLLALVGVKDVLSTAYRMGITTLEPSAENIRRLGLSLTLGGGEVRLLEVVSGYSSFANNGFSVEPVSILKVEDRKGKTLLEHKQAGKKQVLDEKAVYLINSILSDNKARLITFGPNSLLNIVGRSVAVKTGTTNDRRDNWAVGWTKKTVVGVWVGNNDNSPMREVASGVSGASPIWRREMLEAITRFGDSPFVAPEGVEEVELDLVSGYPAHDGFSSYKDWAIKGTLPVDDDPIHINLPLCPGDSSKLANAVQVSQNNFSKGEFIIVKENDPLTADNLWQKAIDNWLIKQTDSRYKPPIEVCGDTDSMAVEILEPGKASKIEGGVVKIRIKVASEKKIEWVDLYLNGEKAHRFESGPYEREFSLEDGVYELLVKARNEVGIENEAVISFGMNQEVSPAPTPIDSGLSPE